MTGEDPYLGSKIAFARVQGFQGSDLSHQKHIQSLHKDLENGLIVNKLSPVNKLMFFSQIL